MKDKIIVSIIHPGSEEDEDFEGRLLGLLTNSQLEILLTKVTLWKKIVTAATVPLEDLMDDYDSLEDNRMVVAIIKRLGSKIDKPVYRRVYISPQIGHVSGITCDREITLTCKDDSLIVLKEAADV
jgi:hypothetical protein